MSVAAYRSSVTLPNSGHFAFLICLPGLANAVPEFCTNTLGFDRVGFHKEFNAKVLAFFREHLINRQAQ
jgi:hypothetical protein